MGKGDTKSRRGKIFRGSYGNSRPKGKVVRKKQAKARRAAKAAKK